MSKIEIFNAHRAVARDDNTLMTPVECLRDLVNDIESGACSCTSVMVVVLDESRGAATYDVGFHAANLSASAMLALLEVGKTRVLEHMGYGATAAEE